MNRSNLPVVKIQKLKCNENSKKKQASNFNKFRENKAHEMTVKCKNFRNRAMARRARLTDRSNLPVVRIRKASSNAAIV